MDPVKHLLPQVAQYFKANLHTHSTVSDGKLTPQEVKDHYKANGYQILSLTDHNIVADHSALNDEDFLMLTGAEYSITQADVPISHYKSYHLNFIAKKPDLLWQPFAKSSYREDVMPYVEKATIAHMSRAYDTDAVNAVIAKANETGHLVIYNHPVWSLQDYSDYAGLKGLWGVELCNNNSVVKGFCDRDNFIVYRDLMNLTGKIFPIAADDSHRIATACGAWIMVGAEKLEYSSVIDALEKGDFYASTGPEIYSLTMEGTVLRVRCSDAQSIALESGNRYAACANTQETLLQEAEFDLTNWFSRCQDLPQDWLRIAVRSADGQYAATRAYTVSELK